MTSQEEDEIAADDLEQVALLAAYIYLGASQSRAARSARRVRTYLTRPELLPNPREATPWRALYDSRSDRAYITTMGLDVETFDFVIQNGFGLAWNSIPIPRADAPGYGALGLILHWLNSTMSDVSLMEIFALIPSTVHRYIEFGLTLLRDTLREMSDAKIQWPKGSQFQENNDLIVRRHPLLIGAFGTMDGLNLPIQESADEEYENASYNGCSVIAFGAAGLFYLRIIACKTNAPGSWHDSRKLRVETPEGFYLVTDTAFPRGTDQIAGRIRAPMKSGERLPDNTAERAYALQFDRQLLSLRQAAEWGNRCLQGSFGRLRIPLKVEYSNVRGDLLEVCFRLYQLRTRRVGINQIRSVYLPIWKEGAQEEIWDHFEQLLFRDQTQNDRVRSFHLTVQEIEVGV
ncbi:hypothetical protein BDZ89DRAFT_1093804 [Hymenopellis radicata]|nr:hypothetical protein BDZ89DRAFT_1093804 [Hymenopellis radicata]